MGAKNGHRHIGQLEEICDFTTIDQLLDDFERDIADWSRSMKAIIEVARRGAAIRSARQQVAAARRGSAPDYRLSFESARMLFSEFTPAHLELLDTLRRVGPCSVYALAKAAEGNDSNVHTDVSRLEELGLIERGEGATILVPFESVEILVPLAQVA